eukprot:COSAG01_NODE_2478_length_7613_cov_477.283737_2_plen_127_part_00
MIEHHGGGTASAAPRTVPHQNSTQPGPLRRWGGGSSGAPWVSGYVALLLWLLLAMALVAMLRARQPRRRPTAAAAAAVLEHRREAAVLEWCASSCFAPQPVLQAAAGLGPPPVEKRPFSRAKGYEC